jgi:signal transduction histidine kinase
LLLVAYRKIFMPRRLSRSSVFHVCRIGWIVTGCACQAAWAAEPLLTTADEVLNLPAEVARRGLPVRVVGVVTYTEQSWAGQFFMQDATGGVFVGTSGKQAPVPGQVVDVRGTSHPGAFAPYIKNPQWSVVGNAPLPDAREISMERFASGIDDGLRVEVRGRVRRVIAEKIDRSTLILSSGSQRFEVMVRKPGPEVEIPASWVGALVRVRGVLAADYQLHRRGLAMVRVFAASPDDVIVEQPEEINPFKSELMPLARVGQYRRDLAPGQRSRVHGVVVAWFGKDSLAIEDDSGGLMVKGSVPDHLVPGDAVEAVGFEGLENFLPVLQDSSVTQLNQARALPAANRPSMEELASGHYHACLVSLTAQLIEINGRPPLDSNDPGREVVMLLQHDGKIFKADFADAGAENAALPFEVGSRVELTGLCLAEANRVGRIDSFRLRLSGPQAVRLIQQPPWLNRRRLGLALLATLAAIILCGGWILAFSRKNRRLRAEIRERAKLTSELQQAKKQLSLRVDERTEELKLQISARKESEVRFKAVIGERTRLAQELHDGLQQGLTGVALQLDTASRLRERLPEQSLHHLELARTLMRQTHADLRNSLWNLRSRSQEDFSLAEALRLSAGRFTDGTDLAVEVRQSGEVVPLTELQEENLLRIGQEALTNAIRHAHSSRIEIHLDFSPRLLVLRIRDFGVGFAPDRVHGPVDGHFGLTGMTERAQRIGASLEIHSSPETGTLIEASLPLAPEEPPHTTHLL